MEKIGEFLKKLRTEKKLSFREASDKSGLSHSYIRYLEAGKRPGSNTPINPTPDTLKKLADAYKHPYEDLMMIAGYISTQYVIDTETNEIRAQTLEESENERIFYRKLKENDLTELILNTEFLSFKGTLLDKHDKNRIIDMIDLIFKQKNNDL